MTTVNRRVWSTTMLLSLREMIVWLGLGPFEAFLHSLGLLVFSVLLTLRVEGVLSASTSWQLVFSPLYVAIAVDTYFNMVMYTRLAANAYDYGRDRIFVVVYLVLVLLRIALTLYTEVEIAQVLDGKEEVDGLVTPVVLDVVYLSLRISPLVRTLPS